MQQGNETQDLSQSDQNSEDLLFKTQTVDGVLEIPGSEQKTVALEK